MSLTYTAVCECGRSNTVEPAQMGGRHPCYCGFMLHMPTAAEFQQNPIQKAYASLLRKVRAHAEGDLLPGVHECQQCGSPTDRQIEVFIACEQSKTETTGGTGLWSALLVVFTVLFAPVIIFLNPEPGVTAHHGRDTSVRVPVCLCEPCQLRLTSRRIPLVLGIATGGAVVSAMVAVFAGWWAILPVVVTMVVIGSTVQSIQRKHRKACRDMLGAVPMYAEMLKVYRFAEVQVPRVK